MNLFRQRADRLSRALEAVGGAGSTDVIRLTDEDQEDTKKRLISVGCVALSNTYRSADSADLIANASHTTGNR